MSVLINMEMPEKIEPGLVIEFADGIDGKRYARLHHYRYGGLTDWLEAVPVPPHGRLIDADALIERIGFEVRHYVVKDEFDKGRVAAWKNVIRAVREYAPTIIPPSGGKKDE